MPLEIERKFRIKMPPKSWLQSRENVRATGLVQCYLTAREGWERRVRQATDALTGEVRCTLTEKTEAAGAVRTELEKDITPEEYEALLPEMLPGTPPLYKVRWSFPYGGHTIEIDCYPFWENEAILEVELSAPDEPRPSKTAPLPLPWQNGKIAHPQPRRNDKNLTIPRLSY